MPKTYSSLEQEKWTERRQDRDILVQIWKKRRIWPDQIVVCTDISAPGHIWPGDPSGTAPLPQETSVWRERSVSGLVIEFQSFLSSSSPFPVFVFSEVWLDYALWNGSCFTIFLFHRTPFNFKLNTFWSRRIWGHLRRSQIDLFFYEIVSLRIPICRVYQEEIITLFNLV